jgi:hypothetical protein
VTTTIKDALAIARINRMKARAAQAWKERRALAAMTAADGNGPSPDCQCPACTLRRTLGGAIGVVLSTAPPSDDDETNAAGAPPAQTH